MNSNFIGIVDTKKNESVGLRYTKSPSLEFNDRSGFPYVLIGRNDTDGVRFDIRAPLGIEGAFEREVKAYARGEKGDARINEAWRRSLRFRCVVPPFADPTITLRKDGRVIWNAR